MKVQTDNLGKVSITIEEDYWSDKKCYDKLTVVEKQGAFGTYISRKPVPAGIMLTNRKYWIPFSSLKEEIALRFGEFANELNALELSVDQKEAEIYKAMASLTAGGLVLKQTFGDSEIVGISQKTITEKIDDLQDQINRLHPGTLGVIISAIPNVVYDGVETEVTITARMKDGSTTDRIYIKIGEEIIASADNESELVTTTIVDSSVTIKALAEQQGFTYDSTTNVSGVKPFYVGSGTLYTDIISDDYKQNIKATPAGTYNVTVENNEDYVFFVVPASMTINSATMSGFTFPLQAPQNVIVDGNDYKVYKSSNTYDAGVITIVIS